MLCFKKGINHLHPAFPEYWDTVSSYSEAELPTMKLSYWAYPVLPISSSISTLMTLHPVDVKSLMLSRPG